MNPKPPQVPWRSIRRAVFEVVVSQYPGVLVKHTDATERTLTDTWFDQHTGAPVAKQVATRSAEAWSVAYFCTDA